MFSLGRLHKTQDLLYDSTRDFLELRFQHRGQERQWMRERDQLLQKLDRVHKQQEAADYYYYHPDAAVSASATSSGRNNTSSGARKSSSGVLRSGGSGNTVRGVADIPGVPHAMLANGECMVGGRASRQLLDASMQAGMAREEKKNEEIKVSDSYYCVWGVTRFWFALRCDWFCNTQLESVTASVCM